MSQALLDQPSSSRVGPKPLTEGKQPVTILVALWAFVVIPFLALIAAVPVAWGGWLGWTDVAIAAVCYVTAGLGITVGFHRYLTHGSFKAKRWLRITLAIAGSTAVQGEVIQWVADHRRHHAYSDLEGDPHSPWRFGTGFWPLAILSFGESWHNLHHADPTCARHGVLRGQIDASARLIWIFEKFGWVRDVRWPRPERIAAKLTQSPGD